MSKDSNSKMKLDDEGWLDEPSNRKKLIRWFYWLCGLIILTDLIFSLGWHKHAAFAEEKPFYSLRRSLLFMVFLVLVPAWQLFIFLR